MAGTEYFYLVLGGVAIAYFYFKYVRPEKIMGGGEIKPVDMQGFQVCSPYIDRPLLYEINENKFYKMIAYSEVSKAPVLKYSVKVKQADEVGGIVDDRVWTFFLEQKVDDDGNLVSNLMPSNDLGCCIPNKPGAWLFSLSGKVQSPQPLANRLLEARDRKIESLKAENKQVRSEQKNEVKDIMNMAGKFSAGIKPPPFIPQM